MTASPYPVSKGDTVELRVERLAFGGQGVARIDGYTVFVPGGLPGQRVEATVLKRKRAYAEARLERVLEPGPRQVTPRCEHFGLCGGCALQHFDHEAQIEAKREQVRECLARLGGLTEAEVEPTLPSPSVYEYRNKMEFSFGTRWRDREEMADGAAEADPLRPGPSRPPALRPRGEHLALPPDRRGGLDAGGRGPRGGAHERTSPLLHPDSRRILAASSWCARGRTPATGW